MLRIEDIDPPREVAGAASGIIDDLAAHGLQHDGVVHFQRQSRALHDRAVDQLVAAGHAYFCQCTRKALRAGGNLKRYPGTCRQRGLTSGAVRVRVPETPIRFDDRWQGRAEFDLAKRPGDFVIRRSDGLIAYQLAVVVDDAEQGITDIVRGIDLFDSTPRQIWLQSLLALPTPRYAHFPVVVDDRGTKLSKQTGAPALRPESAAGNLSLALEVLGLPPPRDVAGAGVAALVAWAETHYVADHFHGRREFRLPGALAHDTGAK